MYVSLCVCAHARNNCLVFAGAFKLAEVDLTPLLPPEALAPFAEEISGRQKRRHRRAEQEARMAQREAADAADAAAAAAIKGLTAQELKVRVANNILNNFSKSYRSTTTISTATTLILTKMIITIILTIVTRTVIRTFRIVAITLVAHRHHATKMQHVPANARCM